MTSGTGSLASFALAHAIAAGDISAREACLAAIARIDAGNPAINAFTRCCNARALQEAQAVDARRARGEALPPLAGVPYAVKDLFDIAGEVTHAGAKLNRQNPPAAQDAFLLTRMQAGGALLLVSGFINLREHREAAGAPSARRKPQP